MGAGANMSKVWGEDLGLSFKGGGSYCRAVSRGESLGAMGRVSGRLQIPVLLTFC